jgi:hypothetical protein
VIVKRRGGFAALIVVLALAGSLSACSRPPATSSEPGRPGRTTLRYGPFDIPAATPQKMGMSQNGLRFNVERPCEDCYITGMQAGLTRADGTNANIDTGLWLHHMVLSDQAHPDLTCAWQGPGLLGQRFFSSGNERSPVRLQGQYGYPQGRGHTWNLVYELMNLTAQPEQVFITVTFDHVPSTTPGYRPMTPMWLDINQCGTSEAPARTGRYHYSYLLTSQWTGRLLGIGGHLHDGGTNLTIARNNQIVCDSVARYGGTPAFVEGAGSLHMPGMAHISAMSQCHGTRAAPVTSIRPGDVLALQANYDADAHTQMGTHAIMGIAIGYFDMT